MTLLLLILMAGIAILLITTILLQAPKSGVSIALGQGQQAFLGAAQVQPLLERLTWGFAAALLILCLVVV